MDAAKQLFKDVFAEDCPTITSTQRLLGGHIGSEKGQQSYVSEKVSAWADGVRKLAQVAKVAPQQAYIGLTKSVPQCEWQFVQRVVKDSGKLYAPLEAVIAEQFLPALLDGQQPTAEVAEERELYSMPVKYGGLGTSDPTVAADTAFATSRAVSDHLAAAIKGEGEFNIAQHQQCGREARAKHKANKKTQLEAQAAAA